MRGTCKWFNEKKGYGFISGEDGNEYFVHYSKILGDGFKNLTEKQEVTFKPGQGPKGLVAIDIEAIPWAA